MRTATIVRSFLVGVGGGIVAGAIVIAILAIVFHLPKTHPMLPPMAHRALAHAPYTEIALKRSLLVRTDNHEVVGAFTDIWVCEMQSGLIDCHPSVPAPTIG